MSKAYQEAVLRGKERTFGQFIWDGEKQAFMGRTLTSWLKIIIFYNIYYGFLAGFFSLFMFLFFLTLDDNMPKYTPGDQSSILRNPALAFRPMPNYWEEMNVIWYNNEDPYHTEQYVRQLDQFIQAYEDDYNYDYDSHVRKCDDQDHTYYERGEVCNFDVKLLGKSCSKENGWGYASGSPCVILKMNKMFGWVPHVFEHVSELPEHMPADLKEHIIQTAADNDGRIKPMVWLSCTQTLADGEILDDIGEIRYSPWRGFPTYFFPYIHIPGYQQPIVAIEFAAPPKNRRIDVECKAWARNINHDRKNSLGMTRFSLEINTDPYS